MLVFDLTFRCFPPESCPRPLTTITGCDIMKQIVKMSIQRAFSKKGDYYGEKSDL